MSDLWRKRLPPLCGGLGCALLAGAAWACGGLTLGGGGDRLFVTLALLAMAALAAALIWCESRRPDWVLLALLPLSPLVSPSLSPPLGARMVTAIWKVTGL